MFVVSIDEDESTFTFQIGDEIKLSGRVAIGAKAIDDAVLKFFEGELSLLIGGRTAREVWITLLGLPLDRFQSRMLVHARDVNSRELRGVFVTGGQLAGPVFGVTSLIADEVHGLIERAALETECKVSLHENGKVLSWFS
jgi:actin-like ATPase involved in cell morphogenesis